MFRPFHKLLMNSNCTYLVFNTLRKNTPYFGYGSTCKCYNIKESTVMFFSILQYKKYLKVLQCDIVASCFQLLLYVFYRVQDSVSVGSTNNTHQLICYSRSVQSDCQWYMMASCNTQPHLPWRIKFISYGLQFLRTNTDRYTLAHFSAGML